MLRPPPASCQILNDVRAFSLILFLFLIPLISNPVRAAEFRLALLHGNEDVFAYEIGVLRLALKHAPGKHSLVIVPMPHANQKRIFQILKTNPREINLFFSGFSAQREQDFLQIDIPITRGLLGHRIFIIQQENEKLLTELRTLEELREFLIIGSGNGWPDTDIFRHNGFTVMTGRYENLWQMLSRGRYHAFNRGIHEAYVEIRQRNSDHPELMIDRSLMIVYPLDYFFYLNKDYKSMGAILQKGLENAYASGAFLSHFNEHPMIQEVIRAAQPAFRRTYRLENPLMTERIRAIPKSYWHEF